MLDFRTAIESQTVEDQNHSVFNIRFNAKPDLEFEVVTIA